MLEALAYAKGTIRRPLISLNYHFVAVSGEIPMKSLVLREPRATGISFRRLGVRDMTRLYPSPRLGMPVSIWTMRRKSWLRKQRSAALQEQNKRCEGQAEQAGAPLNRLRRNLHE